MILDNIRHFPRRHFIPPVFLLPFDLPSPVNQDGMIGVKHALRELVALANSDEFNVIIFEDEDVLADYDAEEEE